MARGLKIRFSAAGSAKNPYEAASVTIPRVFVDKIKGAKDKQFEWKWHPEGLLLVPIKSNETEEVPSWTNE